MDTLTVVSAISILLFILSIFLLILKFNSQKKHQITLISLQNENESRISNIKKEYEEKLLSKQKEIDSYCEKYKGIIDLEGAISEQCGILEKHKNDIINLNNDYVDKRKIYDALVNEINLLEENVDMKSFGVYEPRFNFPTSNQFNLKLEEIRQKQKELIKDKMAAACPIQWEVNGSKVEGRKLTNKTIKMVLRAFNGECDSALAKVKWNNILVMEERIKKSHSAINELIANQHITISYNYLSLKLDELRLVHEMQEKIHEEKEEQRRIREQMREEEKVQIEIEKAIQEAEDDEARYNKALEKAREEINKSTNRDLQVLNKKITELEAKLEESRLKKERALSRAQLTKSGHVYVISNIGSFGEHVYKIGMTRRLDPMERVHELGDASVPFAFDTHAMIYSENAPELETKLHKTFENKRVNFYNNRKEFFKVSLEDIEKELKENFPEIEMIKIPEAKEYRESCALIDKMNNVTVQVPELEKFPKSLI